MTTILFENTNAAIDAADMLQGEWDGFNGVIIEQVDLAVIQFVANKVKSNCCSVGAICRLPITAQMLPSLWASNIIAFRDAALLNTVIKGVES